MTEQNTKPKGRPRQSGLWELGVGDSIFYKGLGRHAQQNAAANAHYVTKKTGRKFTTMRTAPTVTNVDAQGIWVTRVK